MKGNLQKILFIASVALNMVFAVTYVMYKLPLLGGSQPPELKGPLFLHLDLTPHQLSRFKAERDQFRAQLQELGQGIKTKQIELVDLLGAEAPDRQAIEGKQQEIQRLQTVVQDRVIAHFLQESAILNPAQRARFLQLIKARIEASAQACPPWMRPFDQGKQ